MFVWFNGSVCSSICAAEASTQSVLDLKETWPIYQLLPINLSNPRKRLKLGLDSPSLSVSSFWGSGPVLVDSLEACLIDTSAFHSLPWLSRWVSCYILKPFVSNLMGNVKGEIPSFCSPSVYTGYLFWSGAGG